MKVGDLVTPRHARYLALKPIPMLITGVFLDGKHIRVRYGSKSRILMKERVRVINESR